MKTTTEKLTELLRSEKSRLESLLPGKCISIVADVGTTDRMTFAVYCYDDEPFSSESQVVGGGDTLEDAASDLLVRLDPGFQAAELRKRADEIAAQIARLEGRAKA
jgi:hypothetical protein